MIYKRIILACLFILLLPAWGLAKTVKIAVLPWKVNSAGNMDFVKEAMGDMLASRLGSHASVEVARPDLVKDALGSHAGAVTDGAALEAGRKLSADYVVYGSLTIFGSTVSLDAKVVNVADGKINPVFSKAEGLDAVVGMAEKISADVLVVSGVAAPPVPAGAAAQPPAVKAATGVAGAPAAPDDSAGQEGFIIKPKDEGARPVQWKSAPMEGLLSSLAAADLDGDGKKELFVISSTSLLVAVPVGDGVKVVKEIESPTGYMNVSVAAVDSDGDGAPEVYLSRVSGNRPSSVVVEFKDGEYRQTITGVGWLARTARTGKGAPALIGQRFRDKDGFYGPVVELRKAGGKVVESGVFEDDLPRGVDIYRFAAFDFTGDGQRELVAVDKRNYLRVYTRAEGGWKEEWKSADFYGGTLNLVAFTKDDPNGSVYKPVPIEGAFFHADFDADGKAELIIKRNTPGGLGRWADSPSSFKESEILSLSWDRGGPSTLKENWKTQKVEGYMSDFIIDDLDGDGAEEFTMLIVEETGKLFGKPKTYILSYRVSI